MFYFMLLGIFAGGILSVVFGLKQTSGTSELSRTIFGIQSNDLIANLILFAIGLTVVFLSVVSIFVKDLTFPNKYPLKFTIETLFMALTGSSIVFLMSYLRENKVSITTFFEFLLLFVKFGVLHILLQFSGFYSSVFN
jgi:hypothetical protein